MNNSIFDAVRAELSHADPLCPYITVERLYLELVLTQFAERTSQLAMACAVLQRARAELIRAWDENRLEPYQQAALRSIDGCLNDLRLPIRIYRHTVRREIRCSSSQPAYPYTISPEGTTPNASACMNGSRSLKPSRTWAKA